MTTIIFTIDFKSDARNWVKNIKRDKYPFGINKENILQGIPRDLAIKVVNASHGNAEIMVEQFLKSNKSFLEDVKSIKKRLEKYFNDNGQDIFDIVARITAKDIYTDKFYCTFTSFTLCPYNEDKNWFMVSVHKDKTFEQQLQNIMHEILHLQFIHYYKEHCMSRGLNKDQFEDLKEALTFLLNEPEWSKFNLARDKGYLKHKELRKNLQEIWRQNNNFPFFLEKAILFILQKN